MKTLVHNHRDGVPLCVVCGEKCLGIVSFTETGRALCLGCRGTDAEWKRERLRSLRFDRDTRIVSNEHWHYGDNP